MSLMYYKIVLLLLLRYTVMGHVHRGGFRSRPVYSCNSLFAFKIYFRLLSVETLVFGTTRWEQQRDATRREATRRDAARRDATRRGGGEGFAVVADRIWLSRVRIAISMAQQHFEILLFIFPAWSIGQPGKIKK